MEKATRMGRKVALTSGKGGFNQGGGSSTSNLHNVMFQIAN